MYSSVPLPCLTNSIAEPEPIFCWPELPFLRRLRLHLFGTQKRKSLFLWQTWLKEQFIKVNLIQKRLKSSKLKILVYEAGAAFVAWSRSRPNLVGADSGSGTSDFRSRSRPKKWRLRNTAYEGLADFTFNVKPHNKVPNRLDTFSRS